MVSLANRLKRLIGWDEQQAPPRASLAAEQYARAQQTLRTADEKLRVERERRRAKNEPSLTREEIEAIVEKSKRRATPLEVPLKRLGEWTEFEFDDRPPRKPLKGQDMNRLLDLLAEQELEGNSSD